MIIAANFKTNHTRKSTQEYINSLTCKKHQIRIYPPSTAFLHVNESLHVKLGAQNFYPIQNGSFTGEIGANQLEEFDIKSVLIGHSERRQILKETDDFVLEKFNFAKEKSWEIIFCIGEPLFIREEGSEKLFSYLKNQLKNIDLEYENLIIAYEPIWAIGTGKVAKNEDIKEVLDFLRTMTKRPLLYGGSVNEKNVADTFALENCNGVLVGTASLEVESFLKIIDQADKG